MLRPPPQKSPWTLPQILPNMFHILAGQALLSKSSHDGSNSIDKTMVDVGAFVTIHDETENDFEESLSRSSIKKEKISPIKNNSPPLVPTPPLQNLGIYLKISSDTPFEINKKTLLFWYYSA